MNMLISDHEEEKIDKLIRKALKEKAEDINVPDGMKEEIDKKIGRKQTMGKITNKKTGIYILAGLS